MSKTGITGGSGLENPEILESPQEKHVATLYGEPSSLLLEGGLGSGIPGRGYYCF